MMDLMIPAMVVLTISSLLMAGILFRQQRLLTFIACAGTFWEAQWLVLTLINRTVWPNGNTELIFLAGALIGLVPWLIGIKEWSWPYRSPGSGRSDLAVLVLLIGVISAAWLVQLRNGFHNSEWVMHGFYNGDTMIMITLVQRSMLDKGLVSENPFSANEYLEYPSLWHGGLATLLNAFGINMDWMHFLPTLTYLQIIFTIPMFFLLMDAWWPEPTNKEIMWLGISSRWGILLVQAGIIGYVLAVSWDSYIYPQTHFFIMGMWLLAASLLVRAGQETSSREYWWVGTSALVTLVLLLVNAVTGAAVVAVTIVYYTKRLMETRQGVMGRMLWLAGIIGWVSLFQSFSAGDVLLGWPHFSYTAAESIMGLAPVIIILGLAVLKQQENSDWVELCIVGLMGMALLIFLVSQRSIIVANSERFIYHALMVGFPLLLAPIISWYFDWQRLWHESGSALRWLARSGASLALVLIVLLPVLISGARTHDHLMRQDEQRVDLAEQEALDFIRDNTIASDVILTRSEAPWNVPMFTGRAQVRADYWLAPQDDLLEDVKKAFAGDTDAQMKTLQQAEYLLIRQDEIDNWKLDDYEKVFHNGKMALYKTGGRKD